jgi:hypothetical protein
MPNKIGETRKRLSLMLLEIGVLIAPESLRRNYGGNRWNDECRWSGYGRRENGLSVHVTSFASMKDLVRQGEISIVEDDGPTIEVI